MKGLDHHLNEDRYRLLDQSVPLVRKARRGQLFAVMDGVGGAPKGMRAAQHLADGLVAFFRDPSIAATAQGLHGLVKALSDGINGWGAMAETNRPGATGRTKLSDAGCSPRRSGRCGPPLTPRDEMH